MSAHADIKVLNPNMKYAEKLADPCWQKKRLDVFNRDNWTCQGCGDSTTQLEIHHIEYFEGLKPWEYPNEMLITICRNCHGSEQVRFKHENYLLQALKSAGFVAIDLLALSQMIHASKPFRNQLQNQITAWKNK